MHGSAGEEGITLIEIVISLVILGVVLIAFLQTMVGGLRSLNDSGARQTSSQLSTEVIEELRAMSPPEIALRTTAVDLAALSDCTAQVDDDDDGTVDRTPAGYDPDGAGPLACEELVVRGAGAITSSEPFARTKDGVTVTTFATAQTSSNVQTGITRVTIVLDYDLPGGASQVRRQALFSEVSRG